MHLSPYEVLLWSSVQPMDDVVRYPFQSRPVRSVLGISRYVVLFYEYDTMTSRAAYPESRYGIDSMLANGKQEHSNEDNVDCGEPWNHVSTMHMTETSPSWDTRKADSH